MLALKRFGVRAGILFIWCGMSAAPLSKINLLASAVALMCVLFGVLQKERFGGPVLNHWDEALAFLAIAHGAQILEKAAV